MGQYLDKLRRFKSSQVAAALSPQGRTVIEPAAKDDPLIGPWSANCSGEEASYCERCGGGYWIRVTHAAPLQCGRCSPSETRVETLFLPGATAPTIRKDSPGPSEVKPTPPVLPGWLVTYRDSAGRLCGGAEDREHGTVQECRWEGGQWTLYLTDGQEMPLSFIRAVGQTDVNGRLIAAWTVREHGYDGNGKA